MNLKKIFKEFFEGAMNAIAEYFKDFTAAKFFKMLGSIGKYLGLGILAGKVIKSIFKYVKNWIKNRKASKMRPEPVETYNMVDIGLDAGVKNVEDARDGQLHKATRTIAAELNGDCFKNGKKKFTKKAMKKRRKEYDKVMIESLKNADKRRDFVKKCNNVKFENLQVGSSIKKKIINGEKLDAYEEYVFDKFNPNQKMIIRHPPKEAY